MRQHGKRLRTYIDLDVATVPALEALAVRRRWSVAQTLREVVTDAVVGHVCEGCGQRRVDARAVEGSDEWWCRGCRS